MTSRGLALITVLWVLTLLSLIAASFSNSTRTEVKLAFNQAEVARAEALADAGVHAAILGLMASSPALQWRADGTVYGWRFGGGEIRVEIRDEGGKVDLNAASDTLLEALFVAAGESQSEASALVDRIVDFRDPNELRRLNGAEDRDYRAAGLPYLAKDAPFEAVEELRQVLGMESALYDAVAPALTVHARQRQPHEATASTLVRDALTGERPDAEEAEPAPLDDSTIGAIAADDGAAGVEPLEPPAPGAAPGEDGGGLSSRSRINVFTIHAEAQMPSGSVFVRDAVVEIGTATEPPFEFWAWKQGRRSLFPPPADPGADTAP